MNNSGEFMSHTQSIKNDDCGNIEYKNEYILYVGTKPGFPVFL